MKTIEERAKEFAESENRCTICSLYPCANKCVRYYHDANCYIKGADEQYRIDMERACEVIYDLIDLGCDIPNIEKAKKCLTKVIKGEAI